MQCTKLGFTKYELLPINRSVGIGHGMFLAFIADLKALGKDNSLIKFADNCTLVFPASVDITHKLSMSLETHEHFYYILIDFSKAFDTIDHSIL